MKKMKLIFILSHIFTTPSMAASIKDANLSPQSLTLRNSIAFISSDGGAEFSNAFPKDKKEFIEICDSPKFDQLYDCSKVIDVGVKKVLKKSPSLLSLKIANLAAEVDFGADAPNYLQRVWAEFCQDNPKEFASSVLKLEHGKQITALQYLTKGIEKDSNAKLDKCIRSLTSVKLDKVAGIAKSARLKKTTDH